MTHPIFVGGVAVGILDILAAFVVRYAFTRTPPQRVLQGIASGLIGPDAFSGGSGTAFVGLMLHFVIAFGAAAAYYVVSRNWRALVDHPVLSGLAYGVVVHFVMNSVVLPLSRFPLGPRTPPFNFTLTMIAVHMLFVGLPIALAVAWDNRRRQFSKGHTGIRPAPDPPRIA